MGTMAELKVRKLTQNQARVIQAMVSVPYANFVVPGTYISTASGLQGNALGGTVSALERNGFIQPFGRDGRQFNWELIDPDLIQAHQEDSKTLLNMLTAIAGGTVSV